MHSFEFINIKAEKAQAMRNYKRHKMLKKIEVLAALAFLSWSLHNYFHLAAESTAVFLCQNAAIFGQPLYVFLAVNILIVAISVLSFQKPTTQDLYDECVAISNVPCRSSASVSKYDKTTPAEFTVSDKIIVRVDNVVNSAAEKKTIVSCEGKGAVSAVGADAASEVREYERSRSERIYRRGNNRSEMLRRSETFIKQTIPNLDDDGRRSSCDETMNDLSSDEFRMTIETFIAAKKKTLIKENTLDLKD